MFAILCVKYLCSERVSLTRVFEHGSQALHSDQRPQTQFTGGGSGSVSPLKYIGNAINIVNINPSSTLRT